MTLVLSSLFSSYRGVKRARRFSSVLAISNNTEQATHGTYPESIPTIRSLPKTGGNTKIANAVSPTATREGKLAQRRIMSPTPRRNPYLRTLKSVEVTYHMYLISNKNHKAAKAIAEVIEKQSQRIVRFFMRYRPLAASLISR